MHVDHKKYGHKYLHFKSLRSGDKIYLCDFYLITDNRIAETIVIVNITLRMDNKQSISFKATEGAWIRHSGEVEQELKKQLIELTSTITLV